MVLDLSDYLATWQLCIFDLISPPNSNVNYRRWANLRARLVYIFSLSTWSFVTHITVSWQWEYNVGLVAACELYCIKPLSKDGPVDAAIFDVLLISGERIRHLPLKGPVLNIAWKCRRFMPRTGYKQGSCSISVVRLVRELNRLTHRYANYAFPWSLCYISQRNFNESLVCNYWPCCVFLSLYSVLSSYKPRFLDMVVYCKDVGATELLSKCMGLARAWIAKHASRWW